jgi:DEAD/DEAH box helicase domain-containing protein
MPAALEAFGSYFGWLRQAGYAERVAFHATLDARQARRSEAHVFTDILNGLQVRPFWHQSRALELIAPGQGVVIATPTASGKSLCFQVPALAALQRGGTALFLYPTKALAHDQLGKLRGMAAKLGLEGLIAHYDGDTRDAERAEVRQRGQVVFTNPDMLHFGILPRHPDWSEFLSRLELIVVDEVHYYRGVLGSHVGNVLRRLLRIASGHGANPAVVAASATIANPIEHATNLTGLPFEAVTEDSGPRAEREFIILEPMKLDQAGQRRRSPHSEAADVATTLLRTGLKSIVFTNSRKAAELVRRYATLELTELEAVQLATYRAGYTALERRDLERRFRDGEVTVMVATNALELGVDVGGVDCVVMVGYPGSVNALWQRAGRAGRGGTRAAAVLIPHENPLDQYYLSHPELLVHGRPEQAVADPSNVVIHPLHAHCAAREKPIQDGEDVLLGCKGEDLGLVRRGNRLYSPRRYPHGEVVLRGSGAGNFTIRTREGALLGHIDEANAYWDVHPGAIYLHQGENFFVRNLDLEKRVAVLIASLEDYYTQPRADTDVTILGGEPTPYGVSIGPVNVRRQVVGFVKKRYRAETALGEENLSLPALEFETEALWFPVPEALELPPAVLPGAIHALEHTMIGLLPAFVLCERADVGGVSYPAYAITSASRFDREDPKTHVLERVDPDGLPTIFIYDGYPGGVGYARAGVGVFMEWLAATRDLLRDCPCKSGCPRCTLSPKCGNGNEPLDKHGALELANRILARLKRGIPRAEA